MTEGRLEDGDDVRETVRAAIAHLSHGLPAQAPIRDFVHHNTLHGFQALPFPEAVDAARRLTGAAAYLADDHFRDLLRAGRVRRADLAAVVDEASELDPDAEVAECAGGPLRRREVYLAALMHPLRPVTGCQLTWLSEELAAFEAVQPDVDPPTRERLLATARARGLASEREAVADLWAGCLARLGLAHFILHPEDLLDLDPEQAQAMLARTVGDLPGTPGASRVQRRLGAESDKVLDELIGRVGVDLTLRGLLLALTGEDILEPVRPALLRQLANHLDHGVAAWHSPDRGRGFYVAWREAARADLVWLFTDLPNWHDLLDALPDDPVETVVVLLKRMGLPVARWAGYLERLALEIPGWSGMVLWHHLHPGAAGPSGPVDMTDYLAVRLVLERALGRRLCARLWQVDSQLDLIRWHLRHHRAELYVRHALFNARLPEYLTRLAQRLVDRGAEDPASPEDWQRLAHLVWTWRQSPSADRGEGYTLHRSAWPLFRLAQHLGLDGDEVRALPTPALRAIFDCLERLTPAQAGYLWLQAYERPYRDALLGALAGNRARASARGGTPPTAQVLFCMDDREEGYRRHLEEANPSIETFGTAGFFGLPMYWRGLDDTGLTPLCPVGVTPAHQVHEVAGAEAAATLLAHRSRRGWRVRLQDLLHQESRRGLIASAALIALAAPAALALLAAKVFVPAAAGRWMRVLRTRVDLEVPTRATVTAVAPAVPASPEHPRLGYTDDEQADRVEGLLRAIGLIRFAPLVVIVGHGSSSQNNPHRAAYDCGACSGRHGGPNARAFAAMANRAEVRALLRGRGVVIPEDTWFLAAEHDTCAESIAWMDLDLLPRALAEPFARLRADLTAASRGSAHERCRRLASAPRDARPEQALRHVAGRALDFSQTRPELGHANNAAAVIGRRTLTRGVFFDRRVFLISYDPTLDPEGEVLEAILLAATPVGAGINLEYYFSTVSNEHYGSGSKVTHNLAGLFGVMDGASGDLRTGLPRQMIEVHEPMRLQVVVEARTDLLGRIHARQPVLRELIGNAWVHLVAMDPESGALSLFRPGIGFVAWAPEDRAPTTVARSADWYAGETGPLPPALLAGSGGYHA